MRKYLHLFLFALLGLAAKAQTSPAITLTAEVDGNTREFTFAVADTAHTLRIDWGDGTLVETEEIPVNEDGWTYLEVYGTPVGNGEIKIYGEGITLFYCSSTVSGAKITALDVSGAPLLDELVCNTNSISELDLSANTLLTDLTCSNNPITTLDVRANTALTELTATDMLLQNIDLTQNKALTYLSLNNNSITDIDLSNNTALTSLYLLNNNLKEIDVTNNNALATLNINNNQLTELDVTACENLSTLFCLGNKIAELNVGNITTRLTCNNNELTPATLPASTARYFTYAPQNEMQIAGSINVGETLDLSGLDNITGLADGPQATTFTWATESGTVLTPGTDYEEDGGMFTFLKAQDEPVRCTMATAAFPDFTGSNAFKTTAIEVKGGDGIKASKTDDVVIRGRKGLIEAYNLPESCTMEVYDLSGRKVGTQRADASRMAFNVKPGLYIVRANGAAHKVCAM